MKKLVRSIFNKLGYDFIKTNVHSPDKAKKTIPVQVGGYTILMPGNNPQISVYKYYPDSNSQMARLAKLIHSRYNEMTMIDVGANVGDTIAVVRSLVQLPIIAIEGDATSFSFLQKNASQFPDVMVFNQYLGEENKQIAVNIDKAGWNNTILPDQEGDKELDLKTLDDLIEKNSLSNREIKLLKIDTEGFDTIILRGCRRTISKHHPVLYFEYNGQNMRAIHENGFDTLLSLKEYGYHSIHVYDCVSNLILTTTLENAGILKQLHNYAHKNKSMIPYYDLCIFHEHDEELSEAFVEQENKRNYGE